MKKYLSTLLFFLPLAIFSQQSEVIKIDSLPQKGILLDKGWKWHVGDNPKYAKADFDDSAWEGIDPTQDIMDLPQIFDSKIKWLRLDFVVKNKFTEPIGLSINQSGASEIYLNGLLVKQIGHFDVDLNKVIADTPLSIPFYLPVDSAGKYTLAIRYVLQPNIHYTKLFIYRNNFFKASLVPLVPALNSVLNNKSYNIGLDIFKFGIFLILFILHAAFYFNQKNDRAHLLLAFTFLSSALVCLLFIFFRYYPNVPVWFWFANLGQFLFFLASGLQIAVLYYFAKVKIDFLYWVMIAVAFMATFLASLSYNYGNLGALLASVFCLFFLLRIAIIGLKKKIRGFKFLSVGVILNLLAFISIGFYYLQVLKISVYQLDLIYNIGYMAFPIGLSIYMGLKSSDNNKELTEKLSENEILKEQAVNQEKEKQQILTTQNETLEKQVTERTFALNNSLENLKSTQAQLIQSEKMASLGELTAGIAHEIQNPLNFVNNFSEVSSELVHELKEELDKGDINEAKAISDDVIQNLQKIHHHGNRASSIVKGMLEHSRTSSGKKELTDINALADEYLRLAYHGLRAKDRDFNADFETHFDANLPKIEVISQDIGRVLLNLINNAFQACIERSSDTITELAEEPLSTQKNSDSYKPTVSISTSQELTAKGQKQIAIKIKDNGPGIPHAIKDKIFQPFFTTKDTGKGTGLGLSLAYDIVKAHGGELMMESKEGEGSEFVIYFTLNK